MRRSSFFLRLLLVSYRGLSQAARTDTSVPKKFELKKIELYKPAAGPTLATKTSSQSRDSARRREQTDM